MAGAAPPVRIPPSSQPTVVRSVPAPSVRDVCAPPAPPAAHDKGSMSRADRVARLALVVNRMKLFLSAGSLGDRYHFLQLCYALARGIDFSVTAGEVYANAHELPPLIKQVYYKYRNDVSMQAALMVLLISAKGACRKGWFLTAVSNELLAIANEMWSTFTHGSGLSEESKVCSVLSIIISRFYPRLESGKVLVSLEAKRGYDILVADFTIPRDVSPSERIHLLVVHTDNMETSSCLSSPSHVSFLINGRGVEKRMCGYADVGPQSPTDITRMLKYGINLIQAIGHFGGNYVVVVAFMRTMMSPGVPTLQDYVQPVVATVVQDAEVIEGSSKISLNCPISFSRIRTPVKGHQCRHHQCFDFENFMAINAKKPSWRCPHCNQPVNFLDIRLDQNMAKILAATEEHAVHVIISADGSWEVEEHHNGVGRPENPTVMSHRDDVDGVVDELGGPSSSLSGVVDLTKEDNLADVAVNHKQNGSFHNPTRQSGDTNRCDSEERKPFQDTSKTFSLASSSFAVENVSEMYTESGISGLLAQSASPNPVNAVSPSLNYEGVDSLLLPLSAIQSSTQSRQFTDNLPLQQIHFENSTITNVTERQQIPRHVNRTLLAVQALPAQAQISSFHERSQSIALTPSSVPTVCVQASSSVCPDLTNSGMQQYLQIPDSSISSAQLQSMIQGQGLPFALNPVSQQIMNLPQPAQIPASVRPRVGSTGVQPRTAAQLQQQLDAWTQQTVNRPANNLPPRLASIPVQRAAGAVTLNPRTSALPSQHTRFQPAMQPPRGPSFQAAGTIFGSGEPTRSASEGAPGTPLSPGAAGDMATDRSWRPTGRMRGSLSGGEFEAALSRYMLQSGQSSAPSSRPAATDKSG